MIAVNVINWIQTMGIARFFVMYSASDFYIRNLVLIIFKNLFLMRN